MLNSHERPTRESSGRAIAVTSPRQNALDPVRADELDFDVSATRVGDPHLDGDVLHRSEVMMRQHILCDGYLALNPVLGNGCTAAGLPGRVHGTIVDLHDWEVDPRLRVD